MNCNNSSGIAVKEASNHAGSAASATNCSNSDVFIRSYCHFSVMSAQYGSPGVPEKEMLNESKLKDFFMDLNTYSRMRIRMGPGCLSMMSPGCAPSPNPSACAHSNEEEEEKNLKPVQLHR
ncbi:hypothetical protein P3S67_030896 [Capsicum chacoense]